MRFRIPFAVLAFAVCGALAAPAAQLVTGALVGDVADGYGGRLSGVSVTAVSVSGYETRATADGFGRFQFPELVPGVYQLTLELDGYHPRELTVTVQSGSPSLVRAVLDPVVQAGLVGTVTDETGLPLPGVSVRASYGTEAPAALVTDDQGRFSVQPARPGQWTVTADLQGFVPGTASTTVRFAEVASVRLELELDFGVAEDVVVVGTRRAEGRPTVADSPVPVDVFTQEELRSQSTSNMAALVRNLAPSFNVNTQPISDAATVMRPINFRNLAPDHMLVLVNGKRRHRGSVIVWLGNGLSDGSQGPDISTIPAIAVRQVELLRDGAAAQYGSDAIAGVLNFQLKDARSGGTVEVRQGLYADRNAGDLATCGGIGQSCAAIGTFAGQYSVGANAGLPLGNSGFLNLSLEYGEQDPTNRAVQRDDAIAIGDAGGTPARDTAQVWGFPAVRDDLKMFVNTGLLLPGGIRPYAHANYAQRTVDGGFYYRHPHTRSGVFRGPVVDGVSTLLVGDREGVRTGVAGAGGCPTIPVVDHRPDPDALAAVEADPDCFTLFSRFPGGFTPQSGARSSITPWSPGCARSIPAVSPGT